MKKKKNTIDNSIENSLTTINSIESYISHILEEPNFNSLNSLIKETNKNENTYNFISIDMDMIEPYANLLSEKDFYKIVGYNGKKLSTKSGVYQESLLSNYSTAKNDNDTGYLKDILSKALIFQNNINHIKILMKNKNFMKEWRKNFGSQSPLQTLKNSGNMKQINTILDLSN